MKQLLIALAGALLFATLPAFGGDPREQDLGSADLSTNASSVQEREFKKVMEDDDAAMDDVNNWIQENNAFAAKGAGESKQGLNKRIMARLNGVRTNYVQFLARYPTNAPAYLAYGSFLNDIGDEEGASDQYEKSRQLDPKNPAAWNDLANYYGENGPVTNAFAYYAKAIELDPVEPVYYENWATTVYLFRKDAREFYSINESQVFDKALALYRKAIQLDPDNFVLRTDYAESYYGIKPLRTNDALVAWTNALSIAHDDVEREGVYIHLARIKIAISDFAEAQAHLDAVTNDNYGDVKRRIQRNLNEHKIAATNPALAAAEFNVPGTNVTVAVTNTILDMTHLPASSSGQKTP
jgi:tetratricopeptide (TPR) repeat protein